jgi:hypothetical protein
MPSQLVWYQTISFALQICWYMPVPKPGCLSYCSFIICYVSSKTNLYYFIIRKSCEGLCTQVCAFLFVEGKRGSMCALKCGRLMVKEFVSLLFAVLETEHRALHSLCKCSYHLSYVPSPFEWLGLVWDL